MKRYLESVITSLQLRKIKWRFQKIRRELSWSEDGVIHQGEVERYSGLYTFYYKFTEGSFHSGNYLLPRLTCGNEFGNHRIIIGWNGVASVNMAVYSHAVTEQALETSKRTASP